MTVLAIALLAGCRGATSTDLEVEVRNVGFDPRTGSPVVVLQTRDGARLLPIWIGTAEAQAIAMEMQRVTPPRPMTHDLVKRILDTTGIALQRVRISALKEQTFFATLVFDRGGHEVEVDGRPSDAIALALRAACPILVNPALLQAASAPLSGTPAREAHRLPVGDGPLTQARG